VKSFKYSNNRRVKKEASIFINTIQHLHSNAQASRLFLHNVKDGALLHLVTVAKKLLFGNNIYLSHLQFAF
jgi:hypothetical protein